MNRREFLCIHRCSHVTNDWEEGTARRRNTPAVIEKDDVLLRRVKEGWPFTIFSFNKCIMYQVQKMLCIFLSIIVSHYYVSWTNVVEIIDSTIYRFYGFFGFSMQTGIVNFFCVISCHHHVGSSFLCIVFSLNIKESCCGVTHVLSVHQPFFEDHLHLFCNFCPNFRTFLKKKENVYSFLLSPGF